MGCRVVVFPCFDLIDKKLLQAKMRKLKYATSVEKKNSLNCDLEKGQKCMLSKLQGLETQFNNYIQHHGH